MASGIDQIFFSRVGVGVFLPPANSSTVLVHKKCWKEKIGDFYLKLHLLHFEKHSYFTL